MAKNDISPRQVYVLAMKHAPEALQISPGANPSELARRIIAMAYKESTFDPQAKNKKSSARGLLQVTRPTQKYIEERFLKVTPQGDKGAYDPDYNVRLATTYLAYQYKRYGTWKKATHAYNQGSVPGLHPSDGQAYAAHVESLLTSLPWSEIEGPANEVENLVSWANALRSKVLDLRRTYPEFV